MGRVLDSKVLRKSGGNVRSRWAATIPASKNSLDNHQGESEFRSPGGTLISQSYVGFLHGVESNELVGTSENSRIHVDKLSVLGGSGESSEVLVGEVSKLLVVNGSSSCHHKSIGGVVGIDVVDDVIAGHVTNVLLRAKNRLSQSCSHEGGFVEVVEDALLVDLVHFKHLTEDHILLTLNSLGIYVRVLQYIGEDFHSLGHIVLEHTGVIDSLLAGGVSIKVSTHVFNFLFKLLLASGRSSLESHMFQEVRNTVIGSSFVTTASIDPNSNSCSFARNSL
mmetsp:Transcript_92885/g.200824  ORF Transcript_92885/g.200824 Transcript_92885/m.200824 type:complete len:279 (+) Transcript_92885:579-1415(+)